MVMIDQAGEAQQEWSQPVRVLLATLLAAAGAIHLVMVPSHAQEWLPEGIGFALAGWVQVGLAAAVLTRPSRVVIRLACITGIAFIAVWVVSRVWGLPFGPESGVAHEASFVDVTCVLFEAVAVMVGYELLSHPRLIAALGGRARMLLSVIPIGILVVATAAVASPSARDHAHGGGGEAAAGHSHEGGGEAAAGADAGHSHDDAGGGVDDKGLSLLMNGQGEGGGHTHDDSVVKLAPVTQKLLDEQLDKTRPFIEKYPTVADAVAAGYQRYGPFSPGLGAHYAAGGGVPKVGTSLTMTDEALENPMLIFDGISPDSELAGFMYNIFSMDTKNPPEGFIGPNDHWHYHTNVCIAGRPGGGIDAPLGADTSAPKALCDKYGGNIIENTGYMVHVWTVPGYESPQGMFSNLNQKIACPNGSYYTVPMEEIGNRANVCLDVKA